MDSKYITYIGVDDVDIDLFESQYVVPEGMCYDSYLVKGDRIAEMDTVDARMAGEWMAKLSAALGGRKPKREVVITDKDLKDFEEKFSDESNNGKVDFAMFGCPHFTLEEAQYIARHIEGKKLAIPMYILVSSHAEQMAERMGITEILSAAGAEIIGDTCPDQPCWHYLKGKVGITESPKCAYYPRRRGIHFMIRDLDTCIDE